MQFYNLLLFNFILLFFSQVALAATHYVTPNGSGAKNGMDWNNALPGVPSTLIRGDTYVISGGDYLGNITFDDPESGSDYIYIRKASSSDDYNDDQVAGWSATYESDQAVFSSTSTGDGSPWLFSTGYWDLSGLTGDGGGSSGPSTAYGFKLVNTEIGAQLLYVVGVGLDNIKLQYIHFDLIDDYQSSSAIYFKHINYAAGCTGGASSNYLLSHLYIQGGVEHLRSQCTEDMMIDSVYFYDQGRTVDPPDYVHAETFALINNTGITVKNSTFDAVCTSTGGIILVGNTSLVPGCHETDMTIYNNIFIDSNENSCFGSANSSSSSCATVNWLIYNNTFINSKPKFYAPYNSSGHKIKNNIFYDNQTNAQDGGTIDMDYNYYSVNTVSIPSHTTTYVNAGTEDPFVNRTGGDYSLTDSNDAIDAGTDLGASYNVDFTGRSRPYGSAWDIGAYEFTLLSLLSAPAQFKSIIEQ